MRNPFGFEFYPGRRLPVVCRDGATRTAVCTGYAGHGLPASVQISVAGKRRTVSGIIYPLPFSRLLSFEATGRNGDLIGWTSHKPRLAKLGRKLIAATAYSKTAEGLPSDHAAALAEICRTEAAGLTEPSGQESPGWVARRLLRRLWCKDVNRLALFFDRLSMIQSAAGE
jgi:hypothetical protein